MTDVAVAAAPGLDLFGEALATVLILEGGKVDDPHDPGGRTNKGITQRVYNAWRSRSHLPVRDVYLISDTEVAAIYRVQYWEPSGARQMPRGVGLAVFDGAVHSGVKQAVKWLQRALGFGADAGLKVDGVAGNITLDAVRADTDNDRLIGLIIDRREAFLRALKTFARYKNGWMRRITVVEQKAQAWATGSVGPVVEYVPGGNRKAPIEDARTAPPRAPGDLGMGGGIGTAWFGEMIRKAQEQLEPYAALHWVQHLVVGLIVAGIVLAVGSGIYRWWATRKQAQLRDALDPDPAVGGL